jgi:hypothetical protein
MNKYICLFLILLIFPALLMGQLKKDLVQPDFSNVLTQPTHPNSLFSFIDPSKLHMSHSISMSYSTFGGKSVLMNSYVNTIDYQINDQLFLRTNLGIMASPYNTLPNNSFLNNQQFFGGAELNYKPDQNTVFTLRFDSMPYNYYRSSYWDSRFIHTGFNDW